MLKLDSFIPILTEFQEVFAEYKATGAWTRTVDEFNDKLDSFSMFFDKGGEFLHQMKYNGKKVVEFRGYGSELSMEIEEPLYATDEMELVFVDYLDRLLGKMSKAIGKAKSVREDEIRRIFNDVVERRNLRFEREQSDFCYIK